MLLIFGSTGQFGTNLVTACVARNIPYRCIGHDTLDICDGANVEKLIRQTCPSVVINATGVVDIKKCELDPAIAFAVNATAARDLSLACAAVDATLVQTSTHLVFDGRQDLPYVESDLPSPNSVYAASKLAGESLALQLCPRTYVTRFPTLYGARRNNAQGFVEKMIDLLREGAPLRIADDRMDTPTWARDAAEAVLGLSERNADYGIYHIANTNPVSYYDFVCHLRDLIGSRSVIECAKDSDFPSSPAKPLKVAIQSERMPPLRSWQDALAAYVSELAQ